MANCPAGRGRLSRAHLSRGSPRALANCVAGSAARTEAAESSDSTYFLLMHAEMRRSLPRNYRVEHFAAIALEAKALTEPSRRRSARLIPDEVVFAHEGERGRARA